MKRRRYHHYWTDTQIISALQRWHRAHDRAPTIREWNRHSDLPHARTVEHRFGSWTAALRAAGLTPRYPPGAQNRGGRRPIVWTRGRIIATVQTWAKSHNGKPPTSEQWRYADHGRPTTGCVAKHFGSWNAAIAAAGFTPRPVGDPGLQASRRGRELATNRQMVTAGVRDARGLIHTEALDGHGTLS